ncbi:TonB-linked SusC/RagA family outer membrane protein [Filimonas zeae]|uniref:SusC/RagA family TonB-linked outer membrane protein n=1 Tax=Filimonas zeae TaxID=1737353 RepID=A0A917MRT6_9BACT|nr:TonB-dependent receptor [Filimonas zeae]MDR6337740.1 TonB-linked SusC/RagA family outer membrane protein [Filimonas zeae]GGH60041.1 SusC/RagA family TonB-linked outer membrane protein [Filimonas zeae]
MKLLKRTGIISWLSLLTLLPSILQAQFTLTGKVTDETGQPLSHASVKLKNKPVGTNTDSQGAFSLQIPVGVTAIVVSYVGYADIERNISGKTQSIVVQLTPNAKSDDVIVIGYGSQRKSDLTGAVGSVKAEIIEKSGATSIDQVLQGRIAGLQMTQNSGMPGGGSSIQIRGLGSINSTNEPIFVIDGVIISSGTGSYSDNAFAAINPADIETIDVLKDASATAIYGAQGANGVIIITTKRGKAGLTRITADAKYGVQSLPKELAVSNLQDYARHQNALYTLLGYPINNYFADPSLLSKGTNWQREIFKPASMGNYSLAFSGGNEYTTYRLSGGYLKQEGVASGSGFDRITVTSNLDTKIKSWLKAGGAVTISRTSQVITIADWNLINAAVRQSPSVPARNLDGSYGGPEDPNDQLSNPLALSELYDKGNKKLGLRGNVYLDMKLLKNLSLRSEFSSDINQERVWSFVPTFTLGGRTNSEITNSKSQRLSANWNLRNVLTYNGQTRSGHVLNAMLGQEITERTSDYLSAFRFGGNNSLRDIDAGNALNATNGGNTSRYAFSSLFGRAIYSYKKRYLLTTTLRYDGSSNFADGNRWGLFPSAAFAWKLSDEAFMRHLKDDMNLKVRLGYGKVGNSNVRQFAYTANISNVPTTWGNGSLIANVPNPDLTWESTDSYNLGLDLGILDNRVEIVADVYLKRTNQLLLELTLPGITGAQQDGPPGSAAAPWANVGAMQNKGVELTINTINLQSKQFRWTSNVVFTLNRNKVIRLNSDVAQINKTYQLSGSPIIVSRTEAGKSIGEFWGYKTIGRINSAADLYDKEGKLRIALPEKQTVNEKTGIWVGDLIWDDYSKDGVINDKDRQYLGSPLPSFTYGFGNNFTYKNFDLNFFFTGSYGNKVMNFLNLNLDNPNVQTGNITRRAARDYAQLGLIDAGGSASDINNVRVVSGDPSMPRMTVNDVNNNNRLSSRFVESGSYLRLQSVAFSWSFPKKVISRLKVSNAKAYFSAQNVFTVSKYSGYDPEVGMTKDQYSNGSQNALLNGLDPGRYPTPRTITFGLSIGL